MHRFSFSLSLSPLRTRVCESAAAAQEEDVRCRARREEVNEENEVFGGGGGGGELLRLSYVHRAGSVNL